MPSSRSSSRLLASSPRRAKKTKSSRRWSSFFNSEEAIVKWPLLTRLLGEGSRAGYEASVALTLRGDFVGRALAYRRLSDRLQDAYINLGPTTRRELESPIRKPAEISQPQFEYMNQGWFGAPRLEFALRRL